MSGYYRERLGGDRLRLVYEFASDPVLEYLQGEIDFLATRLAPDQRILELGCGYGRVLKPLLPRVRSAWGIDSSAESVEYARGFLGHAPTCRLLVMDARATGFRSGVFDLVACVQNGISAFGVDPLDLVGEALRITRPGGRVIFSSYATEFWPHRLAWFELQAAHGLVGEIDPERTGDGTIVCRDGFRATTFREDEFRMLAASLGYDRPVLTTVGGSSVFCEIEKE